MSPRTHSVPQKSQNNSTLLEEGIQLAQRGERERARIILQRVIHASPETEDAWLWLAWLADDKAESLRLLQEAKQLFPESLRVQEALSTIQGAPKPEPKQTQSQRKTPPPQKAPQPPRRISKAAKPLFISGVPEQGPDPAQNSRLPAVGLLVVALAAVAIVLGLAGAFRTSRPLQVQALELPTPVAAPTATVDIPQQVAALFSQVEAYEAAQDWNSAITELEHIRTLAPDDARARQELSKAHFERGKLALQANDLENAQVDLDAAIRLDASNSELHEVRRSLMLYMDGVRAYQLQDWDEVVHCLSRVRKINTGYRDTDVMLAQGYLGVARGQAVEQDWYGARESLELAISLDPELSEAQQVMIEVNNAITPPKRVEVSLSEHLVRVYENHQVIRTFPMCDGKKGSPTRPGRFPVLDKIPLALASQWGGLQMPWWIGLYYTNDDTENGIENGFHALPYRADQQVMWENSLGGQCSYGCIVLDTEDATWLYDWIEIGTVVFILE